MRLVIRFSGQRTKQTMNETKIFAIQKTLNKTFEGRGEALRERYIFNFTKGGNVKRKQRTNFTFWRASNTFHIQFYSYCFWDLSQSSNRV